MLHVLGVRLFLWGTPPAYNVRPLMLVSNHVSWLDIFVIDAILPVRFIAKSEVQRWPVLGWLCARTGTIFIERGRRHHAARINDTVSRALLDGDAFAVFPEGTTTDGSEVLEFRAALLEPALSVQATVQPVAIRFERPDGTLCTEVAYTGEKSLWATLCAITSEPEILAHVCFLDLIPAIERHRRVLARETREAILQTLFPATPDIRTEKLGDLQASAQ